MIDSLKCEPYVDTKTPRITLTVNLIKTGENTMVFLIIHSPTEKTSESRRMQIDGAIKGMGNWSDRLDNAWLLETKTQNALTIRNQLKQFTPEGEDKLFVARAIED